MEDMTLNNSAANAEVNMNESTSVNENVSVGTDTPTVLPESPVIGFQAVDAEGNVLGFVSKAELVNEAKQALYADLAILEANRPTTLPANDMLAATSTLAATDVYEDQLAIKSDAPYIRGLDATGNPIRISKADLASVVGGLIANAEFTEKISPFLGIGKFKAESFTPERSTMKITLNSAGAVIAFIIPQTSIKYRIEAAIIHTGSLTKLDVISDETEYGRFQKSEGGATASYSGYAYLVCYGINKFVDYNIE